MIKYYLLGNSVFAILPTHYYILSRIKDTIASVEIGCNPGMQSWLISNKDCEELTREHYEVLLEETTKLITKGFEKFQEYEDLLEKKELPHKVKQTKKAYNKIVKDGTKELDKFLESGELPND